MVRRIPAAKEAVADGKVERRRGGAGQVVGERTCERRREGELSVEKREEGEEKGDDGEKHGGKERFCASARVRVGGGSEEESQTLACKEGQD